MQSLLFNLISFLEKGRARDLEADLKLMEIEIVAADQTDTKTEVYIWKRTLPFPTPLLSYFL